VPVPATRRCISLWSTAAQRRYRPVGSGLRKSIAAFAAADYVEYGGSTPLSTA